jgi:hypothetical protein
MHFRPLLVSLALAPIALAAPGLAAPSLSKRCTNSESDRSCWGDYDISTNYYDESPDTGVVREYWFDIVNTTAAPDGIERVVLSVNGTVPGPTILLTGVTQLVSLTESPTASSSSAPPHPTPSSFLIPGSGPCDQLPCEQRN